MASGDPGASITHSSQEAFATVACPPTVIHWGHALRSGPLPAVGGVLGSNDCLCYTSKVCCWPFPGSHHLKIPSPEVLGWFCFLFAFCVCTCVLSCFSRVRRFANPWTIAHQAPLSMGFSRQGYWSGLSCPPGPRDQNLHLLCLLHWQAGSLPRAPPGKPTYQDMTC